MRPAVLRELKDLALIPAPAQAMDAAVTDAESYAAQMRKLWRRAR